MTKKTRAHNYKELSAELDTLMADLEGGELDIDEAVQCYERGLIIIAELEAHLQQAENTVKELKSRFAAEEE